jgi:hypothetical protein
LVDYKVVGGKDGQVMHLLKKCIKYLFLVLYLYYVEFALSKGFGCLLHIWMLVPPNSVGFEVGVVVGAIFG